MEKWNGNYIDTNTGELIEALEDEKYNWRQKRRGVARMGKLYKLIKRPDKAAKLEGCCTWLQYVSDGHNRELQSANFCHDRLCPICASRKARAVAGRLGRVLDYTEKSHDKTQYIFLTLTVRNVKGDELRDTLTLMTKAWHKLTMRRAFVRAIGGWFRAIEITHNADEDTYHPHIHAILAVSSDYFGRGHGLYIEHADWVSMWRQSLQVDYDPSVRISKTYKAKGDTDAATKAAAIEAAKYACKDIEWLDESMTDEDAAKVLLVYDTGLKGKRLTAMGGWIAEAAKALDIDVEADADLIHTEDGAAKLTPETAPYIEMYRWHPGVRDYVLSSRRPNPDYTGPAPNNPIPVLGYQAPPDAV